MKLMMQLRGFFRAFKRNEKGPAPVRHAGHSLASAAKQASHVASGGPTGSAAIGRGQDKLLEIVGDGHENFTKSLEDED